MATPTYDLIEEQVLGSATASVTFSSIPQTYTDLVLECVGTLTIAANFGYRLNGDSGTNYSYTYMQGTGASAISGRGTGKTYGYSDGFDSTTVSINVLHFMSYANASVYKTVIERGSISSAQVSSFVNLWRSTAAVTSIELKDYAQSNNFNSGCTFRLWGIK